MKLRYERRITETQNAVTFIFTPTAELAWVAGQSIKIAVPGEYGALEHRFTISSAPHQRHIAITTRPSSSDYKQSLFSLRPGDEVEGFAIEGKFTWHHAPLPKIFVAAGIGITPFYSMLKAREHTGQPLDAILLYSSPTTNIIFKKQLDTWTQNHPALQTHYIVGERLSAAHIKAVADVHNSLIYISGPSAMVDIISLALQKDYLVPAAHILHDWFTGRLPQEEPLP